MPDTRVLVVNGGPTGPQLAAVPHLRVLAVDGDDRLDAALAYWEPDAVLLDPAGDVEGPTALRALARSGFGGPVALFGCVGDRLLRSATALGRSLALDVRDPVTDPVAATFLAARPARPYGCRAQRDRAPRARPSTTPGSEERAPERVDAPRSGPASVP